MKKQKKKRKGFQAGSMRCPYCGSPVIYRSADGIYHDNSKKTMLYGHKGEWLCGNLGNGT